MNSGLHAVALSAEDCWEVPKVAHVGRLLYTVNALPTAQVARFVVHDRLIIFSLDLVGPAGIMRVEFTRTASSRPWSSMTRPLGHNPFCGRH